MLGWAKGKLAKTIDLEDRTVKIKKQLGQGGFAFVHLVKDKKTKEYFALKQTLIQDDENLARVEKEAGLMKALSPHPHIVRFISNHYLTSKGGKRNYYVLMENCPGGSLLDVINQHSERKEHLAEDRLLSIFEECCAGVAHMHTQVPPICHRDIKAENLLLSVDGRFKLCDFGSATTKTFTPETTKEILAAEDEIERMTTLQYRAPEMVDLHQKLEISQLVDVWAAQDGRLQILNAKPEIPSTSPYSQRVHNIICACLDKDPRTRPDIAELLRRVHTAQWEESNPPEPEPAAPADDADAGWADFGSDEAMAMAPSAVESDAQPASSAPAPAATQSTSTRSTSTPSVTALAAPALQSLVEQTMGVVVARVVERFAVSTGGEAETPSEPAFNKGEAEAPDSPAEKTEDKTEETRETGEGQQADKTVNKTAETGEGQQAGKTVDKAAETGERQADKTTEESSEGQDNEEAQEEFTADKGVERVEPAADTAEGTAQEGTVDASKAGNIEEGTAEAVDGSGEDS